jgi:hypothetical protein
MREALSQERVDDGQEVSRRGDAYLNTVNRVKNEGTL